VKSFDDFLRRLELLEWSPAGYMDPALAGLLSEVAQEPRLVSEVISSWSPDDLERRQLRCHETSTHYKWFVSYHKRLRYRIWLHQYKVRAERNFGHAEVPHNHRYSLASAILQGGFVHHYFERTEQSVVELLRERRAYSQGDAYVVDWQRFHKLSDLSDNTVTLVVESPVARHYSEAFYGNSGRPSLFYDFVGLHSRLIGQITA